MTTIRRFLAGLTLLLIPATAAAQNTYADQVMGYLDGVFDNALGDGYTLEGESHGWMMNGASGAAIVRLPAGRYVAIGACDNDCEDIDLMVSRMDDQEMLDSDQELDSFPFVEFTLAAEADIMIGMSMPTCSTDRCYAGYRWYRADLALGGGGGGGTWEDQVMAQLGVIPMGQGMELADERTALVEAGAEHRFSLNLGPGSYSGIAVCDNDCSNVDLVVYDAGGSTVSSDVLDDDVPIVEFNIVKGGGTYYFEVRMVDCSTAACGFGFNLFREGME